MIELSAVTRIHGSGAGRTRALDEIDLEIESGEFVAVTGPSGSGKTSLLNLIGALDEVTEGHVRVAGQDLSELSEDRRAQLRLERIGFIFQQFNLIPVLNAEENVELPLLFRRDLAADERRRRVRVALERVGLAAKHRGRRPSELSGGEQQRVAVARALAGRPAVVLADEPTANLDQETGAAVIELMQELNRERETTFLYATHDSDLIALAGRVIRLRHGRLATSP